MKYQNKLKNLKVIALCIALLFTVVTGGIMAYASDELCSITVDYHGRSKNNSQVQLAGARFAIYQVGKNENGKLVLNDKFKKSGVSLLDSTASAREVQAEKLYKYAISNKISRMSQITDNQGKTVFRNLDKGIYLVAQTDKLQVSDDETYVSSPFLIMVPAEIDGNVTYNIVTEPKSGWGEEDEEENAHVLNPDIPVTGRAFYDGLFIIILLISVSVIIFTLFARHSMKRKQHSDE